MRTRVAGIIPINNGFALMHRTNVKRKQNYNDYYVFPGGGLEENETLEEGAIREIKEEFGIDVKIEKLLYEIYQEEFNQKEYFFLCQYVSGELGTGDGPEFSNDPKYIDCGNYTVEVIPKNKIKDTFILPPLIKEKLINDIENNII